MESSNTNQNITPQGIIKAVSNCQFSKPDTTAPNDTEVVYIPIATYKSVLEKIKSQVKAVDFRSLTGLTTDKKITKTHYIVGTVDYIIDLAKRNGSDICVYNQAVYTYNGSYWVMAEKSEFTNFLGDCAKLMGVDKTEASYHLFKKELYDQFSATANLPAPEKNKDIVLVNLLNGTFEISPSKTVLRKPLSTDFITHQLPFKYCAESTAPIFKAFLNKVLPDINAQNVLAEYIGYLFINNQRLKLEKALFLYGSGANGKSVVFEILVALLGRHNICFHSIKNLTVHDNYKAELENKLLNYSSETGWQMDNSAFKCLASGEPIIVRPLYQKPYSIENYAKLMFNGNELPKDTEQTKGFFRRFLIVPFNVTIPEAEQDKQLARKITEAELSGVFNWVLEGLTRLLSQNRFSQSDLIDKQQSDFEINSDNVQLFLGEEGYIKSHMAFEPFKTIYNEYKAYCSENTYRPVSSKTFSDRIRKAGFETERKRDMTVIYISKSNFP